MDRFVFIYSQIPLVEGNSAGTQRMNFYSKMLAEENVLVYNIIYSVADTEMRNVSQVDRNIYKVNEFNVRKISILKKIKLYLCFVRRMYKFSKNKASREARVFLLYPTIDILFTFITLFYLKFKGERVFIEFNEVRKVVYSDFFLHLLYSLQDRLLFLFDGTICISKNIMLYSKKYTNKICHIPIISDYNINLEQKNRGIQDPFIIMFSGTVSFRKENLFALLEGLRNANKNFNWNLHLYGSATEADKNQLEEYIRKNGLEKKIYYFGVIDHKEILKKQKESSLLVLPRRNILQNYYGFSTKLSEYIQAQVPILLTDTGNIRDYFANDVNCFLVEGYEADDFTRSFDYIFSNYLKRADSIVFNALQTGQIYFDYRLYKEKLLKFLYS